MTSAAPTNDWVARHERWRRHFYWSALGVLVGAGALALMWDSMLYAPVVAFAVVLAYAGVTWSWWWAWRGRTDPEGRPLIRAALPRGLVELSPSAFATDTLVPGILTATETAWTWQPAGVMAQEFRAIAWRHPAVVAAEIIPAWRPCLPAVAYLRLSLADGSTISILVTEPERVEAFVSPPAGSKDKYT